MSGTNFDIWFLARFRDAKQAFDFLASAGGGRGLGKVVWAPVEQPSGEAKAEMIPDGRFVVRPVDGLEDDGNGHVQEDLQR